MRLTMFAAVLLIFVSLGIVVPQNTKEKKDKKPPAPLTVKLNTIVLDSKLKFVTDLSQDQFRIFEDEVPQTISTFQHTLEPRDYVLAIDTSLSLRFEISSIIGAAKLFVTNVPPEHEVMLMRFISSDKINIEADFTSDKAKLIKAAENLYLEGGQSSIIDAVYLANDDIEKHTKGETNVRRALVLITDGDERHSYYTREKLFKRLHETGLQVFTIGFTKSAQQRYKAQVFLNSLALESGGNLYDVDRTTDMGLVIKEILFEMMAPYVIGYESTNPARDGTFRKVRVEVVRPTPGENLAAFARKGYTATMK